MVRFKNRYVLCEVVSEDPRCRQCIEDRTVGLAVRDAIARAHGDYGLACCSVSFTVKYLNAYTGTVLLRCRKDFYRLLCSALPFVRQLESRNQRYPCFFNTLHVGGQRQPRRLRHPPRSPLSVHARRPRGPPPARKREEPHLTLFGYYKNMSEISNSV
ncbi:ribonuclease P/MRP protein subunit POP5 isoform X2 [Struthio camelus]|uniref:ribonuclease P/MRP protein subunit POP5 isoform X2 n=1 Tax=Struthio camelus TaxID=8801 RepID=UPI003603DF62